MSPRNTRGGRMDLSCKQWPVSHPSQLHHEVSALCRSAAGLNWCKCALYSLAVDNMGRMFLAGGAAVGLGALCYYGLGMSNEIGAIERAV